MATALDKTPNEASTETYEQTESTRSQATAGPLRLSYLAEGSGRLDQINELLRAWRAIPWYQDPVIISLSLILIAGLIVLNRRKHSVSRAARKARRAQEKTDRQQLAQMFFAQRVAQSRQRKDIRRTAAAGSVKPPEMQLPTKLRTNSDVVQNKATARINTPKPPPALPMASRRDPVGSLDLPSLPDGYRDFMMLGSGGFGDVLYALRNDGTPVAIKRLRRSPGDRGIREKWFRREVRLLSELNSHAIPKLLDHNLDGPHPYFVMEYIDGNNLDHQVDAHGPLKNLRVVTNLAVDTATALAEIHSKGFLHRDIKPGNVMLTRAGRCKLIDLGISKDTASDSTASQATAGTLAFAAPESLTEGGAGSPADVFSWGAMLGYALTGLKPYGDASGSVLLMKVARGEISDQFVDGVRAIGTREHPNWGIFAKVIELSTRPDPALRDLEVLVRLSRPQVGD